MEYFGFIDVFWCVANCIDIFDVTSAKRFDIGLRKVQVSGNGVYTIHQDDEVETQGLCLQAFKIQRIYNVTTSLPNAKIVFSIPWAS